MISNYRNDLIMESFLPYRVGALMYTPALNSNVVKKLERKEFPGLCSLVICLEDSIEDSALARAEAELFHTLEGISKIRDKSILPLIFVRIRTPDHLLHIHSLIREYEYLLTGYVLPKFDTENAGKYISIVTGLRETENAHFFIMPTLESKGIADAGRRLAELAEIKRILDSVKDQVINVRVGGNDLSNLFGLRRGVDQTIYDLGVVRNILIDIVNVFVPEYVVSGPVWEYFGTDDSEPWADGLRHELELDALNGFIGKTAIHPSQLPIIYESLRVHASDYQDACRILNWESNGYAVRTSANGSRMNERKCHSRWAERISILARIYGVRGE